MRELNAFNKTVLQKFSSRQAYQTIKGHYIPIIWDNVSDESVMDIEKRKYYIQTYDFTMMGFLLDEDEFEVKPGVERVFQIYETAGGSGGGKKRKKLDNPSSYDVNIEFTDENTFVLRKFYDKVDLNWISSDNVSKYEVYIDGEYYGSDLTNIKVNSGDNLKFEITKIYSNQTSNLKFVATLV